MKAYIHYILIINAFAWSTIIATLDYPLVKLFDQSVIAVVRNQDKKSSIVAFLSGVAVDTKLKPLEFF